MTRGIFFDLYGTLFVYGDMERAWSEWFLCLHSSLESRGLKIDKEELSQVCDSFFGKDEPAEIEPKATVFENRIGSLCRSLNQDFPLEELTSIATSLVETWQQYIHLDQDATAVLTELGRNNTLGLVSNFDHPPHVRKFLSHYELQGFFETIVISGEVGVKKPDPGIFEPALSATGLAPEKVVYIGDTEDDISAATAANMKPILIQRSGGGTDPSTLDYQAYSVNKADAGSAHTTSISSLRELVEIYS